MNKYDFCILTRPRSGSHMLASALDSHPNIRCFGENFPRYNFLGKKSGDITGCISHVNGRRFLFGNVQKFIVLLRDLSKRDDYGSFHCLEPNMKVKITGKPMRIDFTEEDVINRAGDKDKLVLHYEDITGCKNIRELPKFIEIAICDFLDVPRHTMNTKFYKPDRIDHP